MAKILPDTIEDLDLPIRIYNILVHAGLTDPKVVFSVTGNSFLKLKSFGRGSLKELQEIAAGYGIDISKNTQHLVRDSTTEKWVLETPKPRDYLTDKTPNYDRPCVLCGTRSGAGYLVHNHVWQEAGMKVDEVAHIWCLEKRLRRPLTAYDFEVQPINYNLLWVMKLYPSPKEKK